MKTYDMALWPMRKPASEVTVVAVGGFPVSWLPYDWKTRLREGFGHGAVLTYGNPKGKTLSELAVMCGARNHLWWTGALSMTWLVYSTDGVEIEIARSGEAHMSWQEARTQDDVDAGRRVFLASFDLRSARKYFRHADDPAFNSDVRRVLGLMRDDLTEVMTWMPGVEP